MDIVTTAPSVVYHITKTDGEMIAIDNPTNYPDPSLIAQAEEPITNAHIYTPKEYVGNIMDLCQERRGVFKDMNYIDTDPRSISIMSCRLMRSSTTFSMR